MQFENAFIGVAVQFMEESLLHDTHGSSPRDPETRKGWILVSQSSEAVLGTSENNFSKKTSVQTLPPSST